MEQWYKISLFCLLSFTFIGCDRVTKTLAKEQFMNKDALSYFHDVFRLEYVENTGAALGFGENLSKGASFWLLSILSLRTGIFNFADLYITIGVIAFLLLYRDKKSAGASA